jgi:TolA-binding protein
MKKIVFGLSSIFILFILAGCSKSDKGLWDEAVKFQKEGKMKEAVASYNKVTESHPESPLAPKALFEIGKIYQSKSVKDIKPIESLNRAIEYYGKIFNDYPKSDEAPKALFMKGFIQSYEVQDYPAAKATFNIFIQKFPDNEMVPSAKAEIATMGKSPEEILDQNLQSKK